MTKEFENTCGKEEGREGRERGGRERREGGRERWRGRISRRKERMDSERIIATFHKKSLLPLHESYHCNTKQELGAEKTQRVKNMHTADR